MPKPQSRPVWVLPEKDLRLGLGTDGGGLVRVARSGELDTVSKRRDAERWVPAARAAGRSESGIMWGLAARSRIVPSQTEATVAEGATTCQLIKE